MVLSCWLPEKCCLSIFIICYWHFPFPIFCLWALKVLPKKREVNCTRIPPKEEKWKTYLQNKLTETNSIYRYLKRISHLAHSRLKYEPPGSQTKHIVNNPSLRTASFLLCSITHNFVLSCAGFSPAGSLAEHLKTCERKEWFGGRANGEDEELLTKTGTWAGTWRRAQPSPGVRPA